MRQLLQSLILQQFHQSIIIQRKDKNMTSNENIMSWWNSYETSVTLVEKCSSMTFTKRPWRRQNRHALSSVTKLWRISLRHWGPVTYVNLWWNTGFCHWLDSILWRMAPRHWIDFQSMMLLISSQSGVYARRRNGVVNGVNNLWRT